MAISAYRRGQLKKHPLLGTSFATDPSLATERARFMELHQEASQSGQDRPSMLSKLAGRFREFGGQHTDRLNVIEGEKSRLPYGQQLRGELLDEERQRKKYLSDRAMLFNAFLGKE